MAHGARHYFKDYYSRYFAVCQSAHGALALAATAWLSACLLWIAIPSSQELPVSVQASTPANSNIYYSFLDSRFRFYFSSSTFSERFALRSGEDLASNASPQTTASAKPVIAATETSRPLQHSPSPLHAPPQRPAQSAALGQGSQIGEAHADGSSADKKTIFEKLIASLFGTSSSSPVRLAYATADDSQISGVGSLMTARYDKWTAVYDISAHAVYMPDGTKLEAHSGLGESLDDPAAVDQKDRGPTPPNVYNLEPREQPFHGVSALRLIPVDSEKALGRTGLLAHSYLLGPNGDSNGCLSLKDYDVFLRAYARHQIKRLVVVARLD
jgi:hypothetical protein